MINIGNSPTVTIHQENKADILCAYRIILERRLKKEELYAEDYRIRRQKYDSAGPWKKLFLEEPWPLSFVFTDSDKIKRIIDTLGRSEWETMMFSATEYSRIIDQAATN